MPAPAATGTVQPGARRAALVAGARGAETHRRILETAVEVATREGLEGLTIGKLAAALAMSKAGLFQHFGSKEDLQLATVAAAREIFIERAMRPALGAAPGLPRLWALCEHWLAYSGTYDGGCFFAAASAEFDQRPGQVRDRIAATMKEWLGALARAVADAQERGHLRRDAEPAQVAFELNALELAANWARQLLDDRRAVERSKAAMRSVLVRLATAEGLRVLGRGRRPARGAA